MKISEHFKRQYLNYLKSYLPQEIVQQSNFQSAVFSHLDELIERSSSKACQDRKEKLSLSCEAHDLAEKTLRLANGIEFIAGVRFRSLDTDFPFIGIHTHQEMSANILCEMSEIVQNEFKNVRPKGLMFKGKPNAYPNFEKWCHTVFGKIEKREISQIPLGLRLSFTQNLDWYQQYVAEYQERMAEKKELAGFVGFGKLDEFQEAVTDQALLVAHDLEGFCGVIAGTSSSLYGLPAVYMIQSYLSKRWVGKKVAPIAHAVFQNEMSTRFHYVSGTIYDQNLSSLRTALRTGRRVIETEYFVRF